MLNTTKNVRQVPCQYCAETLSSKKKYVRHCQKFHPNEAPLEIENEENLRITLKEKKHNCPTCSKKFTSKKWLVLHKIKVHNIKTDETPSDKAPCPYCQEVFTAASLKFVNHLKLYQEIYTYYYQGKHEFITCSWMTL